MGSPRPNPHLPIDAIEEIFSWLPVKSVYQSRCVSKSFSSLTRIPHFIDLHRQHSNATNLLISYLPGYNLDRLTLTAPSSSLSSLETLECLRDFTSMQCCDGLIAMHSQETLNSSRTLILNPGTRETLALPFNKCAFEGYAGVNSYVGFEPEAKKYKVMIIGTWHDRRASTHCEIVTLGTDDDSWRRVDMKGTPPIEDGPCTSFTFRGALHWLSFDGTQLLAFDLKSEEFRTIPGPEKARNGPITARRLCEVRGCLALAEVVHRESGLSLWVLRDYDNNVWVEETIVVSSSPMVSTGQCVDVVGSITDDEVLITWPSTMKHEMVCYDMKAKTCRSMEVRGTHETQYDRFTMLYRECMVSFTNNQQNKMIVNC